MKRNQLLAIMNRSLINLKCLFQEHEDEILAAIDKIEDEAANQEADKIVINLSHGIKIDLTGKSQTDNLTYSIRTKLETVNNLPNPDEPFLPFIADID